MKLDPTLFFSAPVDVSKFTAQLIETYTEDASPAAVLSLLKFLRVVNDSNRETLFHWSILDYTLTNQIGLDVGKFVKRLAKMEEITRGALSGEVSLEYFGAYVVGPLVFGNLPTGQRQAPLASQIVSVANQIGAVNKSVDQALRVLVSELTLGLIPAGPDEWTLQEKLLAAGVATVATIGLGSLLLYSIRK